MKKTLFNYGAVTFTPILSLQKGEGAQGGRPCELLLGEIPFLTRDQRQNGVQRHRLLVLVENLH